MRTDDLIRAISADAARRSPPLAAAWWAAAALAVAVAAVAFFVLLGPRADFALAVETPRFLFKFLVTGLLAASAFVLLRLLARPGAPASRAAPFLALAPLLLAAAVVIEFVVIPPADYAARLVGSNLALCLTFIPLIGIAPLAVFLGVLRYGAPTRPVFAGAVAGIAAGGLAATFYAAHCTDDSPLFVATWYSLAIASLACVGALAAPRLARW
ncbi:MAG: DUF1109 family protein [Rhizobiaceae bacterium]|nr:MAG: DUF1109 family protein [Rhizobiaceae bacterium]CAG1008753.1 Anti-sigma-F factor NrsF [Rhizobiaceae bacterium]